MYQGLAMMICNHRVVGSIPTVSTMSLRNSVGLLRFLKNLTELIPSTIRGIHWESEGRLSYPPSKS